MAARLVEYALGSQARQYFRSSERCFPLFYEGRYFSVAHSPATTVVVVAGVPIGVDVEQRLTRQACSDLAWAWSPEEGRELVGEVAEECTATEIWTAKEAAGKALGVGLQAMPFGIASTPSPTADAHRDIVMSTATGEAVSLDSHGMWCGESHLRVAWRLEPPAPWP
ncbi:4'-phosphopantetheinyl transferase superfamily protein [Brevibacterium sp. XM4083]|uniref:4'-phosphopantetheinyl transferase superfamily protein n=1 Tax=Brevibacterium sp. XM4083 TaxID=2583238 RepID=UPI001C63C272|nr:4'-phosphopantetheinyl transferase superfamily protein [Brevibacterium sp. XM4083]